MSKTVKNKNVRLSYHAWKALRNLKFDTGKNSYTEVFGEIFDVLKNKKTDIDKVIISKKPSEEGTEEISKSDKTIVIESNIQMIRNQFHVAEEERTSFPVGSITPGYGGKSW